MECTQLEYSLQESVLNCTRVVNGASACTNRKYSTCTSAFHDKEQNTLLNILYNCNCTVEGSSFNDIKVVDKCTSTSTGTCTSSDRIIGFRCNHKKILINSPKHKCFFT
jgi:hypothetical protein